MFLFFFIGEEVDSGKVKLMSLTGLEKVWPLVGVGVVKLGEIIKFVGVFIVGLWVVHGHWIVC
jgi:hypothetical protein